MTEYLGVAGTHGTRRADEWNHLGSPFTKFMLSRGFASFEERARVPFYWSTDLDTAGGGQEDWTALAYAVYYWFVAPLGTDPIPGVQTRIIAHSHAGQGVIRAARLGLKIDCLVTVGTPICLDDAEIDEARKNIKRWLHLYSPRDWTQIAGELLDGRWGINLRRRFKQADRNEEMPKGHGDVLRDPALFSKWVDAGWLAYLKGDSE